ncbi:MAG: hypothetical protein R2939_20435 [Kofleriaceae bacterium]
MCGPKFCSMKITQDVRDFAAAHPESVAHAEATAAQAKIDGAVDAAAGMAAKAEEFQRGGGSLYAPPEPRG